MPEKKIFQDYITFEIDYHQKRYLEGENRAARLAGVCGTLATLLTTAALAVAAKPEMNKLIPLSAYVTFSLCIFLLFGASVVSLLGILPTDKYGNLSGPIKVQKWVKHIESATIAIERSKDDDEVLQRLELDSAVILWTEKHENENIAHLVLRSKVISLLAFKRSIGIRQRSATFAIFFIIISMFLMVITVLIMLLF